MKHCTWLAALLCLLVACQKTPIQPPSIPEPKPVTGVPIGEMYVTDFNNRQIAFKKGVAADLNADGTKDFYVYTQHIGDALLQRDYKAFLVGTSIDADLPIDAGEAVPVVGKGQLIDKDAFHQYNWFNAASITVARKVITANSNWWEGSWLNKTNQYLPLRIRKADKFYYGWVEISFDSHNEMLVLHRAAVNSLADVPVTAGN